MAPARRAAVSTASPTPPSPITATDSPAATRAVLRTAPAPVSTAQPSRAARSGGSPAGIGMTALSGTTTASASAPRPRVRCSEVPSSVSPRATVGAVLAAQSQGSSCWHHQQVRQAGAQLSTTGVPTVSRQPTPASATTPVASCPSTSGNLAARVPFTMDRSEWQMPAARIVTRRSPGPGAGRRTCSTRRSAPTPRATSARTVTGAATAGSGPLIAGSPSARRTRPARARPAPGRGRTACSRRTGRVG